MSSASCPNCRYESAVSRTPATYHYKESGLPNVWLRGGVTEVVCERCGETSILIAKEPQLLQVITIVLLMKQGPLTGPETRLIRSSCEMTQADLAQALKLGRRETVSERESKDTSNRSFTEELGLRLILLKSFREYIERPGCSFLTLHHIRQLDAFADSFMRSAANLFAERFHRQTLTAKLDRSHEQWELPKARAA